MNGFNDKELQRIWDCLGLPADVSKQEEFERMVHEWRNADMEPKRIVRCRDCKHRGTVRFVDVGFHETRVIDCEAVEPNGFCAWGERKSE